jgi:hypothetical protein
MTFARLFKNSVATAAVATSFLATSVLAYAQNQPQGENNGQYTSPPAPASDPNAEQYNDQNAQNPQQPMAQQPVAERDGAYAPPQNGAPSGIEQAPPAIPDYQQPESPGDGYIWTPGYWAWTADGYEWVNGAWVAAPYTGALWTPGYWGYNDGYFWNTGYWGPVVGYYGGINYGFGYFGIGFYGGYWGGGRFWYNRTYCNLGPRFGGYAYSRPYSGYSGHAGGASFVRTSYNGAARPNAAYTANRGSTINGSARASSFNQSANHGSYGGAAYNGAGNYNGASRTYARPSAQSQSRPAYNGGGSSAPHASAPSGGGGGGGYHGGGSGGGGGGSHGGGGGHR